MFVFKIKIQNWTWTEGKKLKDKYKKKFYWCVTCSVLHRIRVSGSRPCFQNLTWSLGTKVAACSRCCLADAPLPSWCAAVAAAWPADQLCCLTATASSTERSRNSSDLHLHTAYSLLGPCYPHGRTQSNATLINLVQLAVTYFNSQIFFFWVTFQLPN